MENLIMAVKSLKVGEVLAYCCLEGTYVLELKEFITYEHSGAECDILIIDDYESE